MNIPQKTKIIFSFLLILFIGCVFRFHMMELKSLSGDEALTITRAQMSYGEILHDFPITPVHYFLVKTAFLCLGTSVFALRFFSLLLGIISIFLIYQCGKRFFHSETTGLLAALLLAISPIHIEYSADGRYYSIRVFLALASILSLMEASQRLNWKWWGLWLIVSVISCLNHSFSLLFVGIQVIYIMIWFGIEGWPVFQKTKFYQNKKLLGGLIAFIVVLPMILYYAFFNLLLPFLEQKGYLKDFFPDKSSVQIYFTVNYDFIRSVFQTFGPYRINYSYFETYLLFSIFLSGLVLSLKKHQPITLLALLTVIIPFPVLMLLSTSGHFFESKYIISILPFYLLFISQGIILVSGYFNRFKKFILVMLFFSVLAMHGIPLKNQWIGGVGTYDFKGIRDYLKPKLTPRDLIITEGGWLGTATAITLGLPLNYPNLFAYIPSTIDPVWEDELFERYDNIWIISQQIRPNAAGAQAYPWYSTNKPWGPFVYNQLNGATDSPEEVDRLNKLFQNVYFTKGLTLFELRKNISLKTIGFANIGKNTVNTAFQDFYSKSKDLDDYTNPLLDSIPLTRISHIAQDFKFERTGFFDVIYNYQILTPTPNPLILMLDGQPLKQIELTQNTDWISDTIQCWINSGIHKIELTIGDDFNLDTQPKVALGKMQVSLNERAYYRQIKIPIRANFNNQLELVGYALSTNYIKSGQELVLTNIWKKTGIITQPLEIYTLIQSEYGKQVNYKIVNNTFNISMGFTNNPEEWALHTYLYETIFVKIPKSTPSDIYSIRTLIYDGQEILPILNYYPGDQNHLKLGNVFIQGSDFKSNQKAISNNLFLYGVHAYRNMNYGDAHESFYFARLFDKNNPYSEKLYNKLERIWGNLKNYRIQSTPITSENQSNFNNQYLLVDASLNKQIAYAGDGVEMKSIWKPLSGDSTSYSIIVHLDLDDKKYFRINATHQPAAGLYPTDRWLPGEIINDQYYLDIPPDTPTGNYQCWIGLYDPISGKTLSYNPSDPTNNRLLVGNLFILGKDFQGDKILWAKKFLKQGLKLEKEFNYPESMKALWKALELYPILTDASRALKRIDSRWQTLQIWELDEAKTPMIQYPIEFDNGLSLAGYDVSPPGFWKSGDEIQLTYYWKTKTPLNKILDSVTHIEHDGALGIYYRISPYYPLPYILHPTTSWETGKLIREVKYFKIPENTPSGQYTLLLGTWDNTSMLNIIKSPKPPLGQRVPLESVIIQGKDWKTKKSLLSGVYNNLALSQESSFLYREAISNYSLATIFNPSPKISSNITRLNEEIQLLDELTVKQLPDDIISSPVTFGDKVNLIGYKVKQPYYRPGEKIHLTFFWKKLSNSSQNYTPFIHLDLNTNSTTFHYEPYYPPFMKQHPFNDWPIGEYVKQELMTQLPSNLPSGIYKLYMGFWDGSQSLQPRGNCIVSGNRAELMDLPIFRNDLDKKAINQEYINRANYWISLFEYNKAFIESKKALLLFSDDPELQNLYDKCLMLKDSFENPLVDKVPLNGKVVNAEFEHKVVLEKVVMDENSFKKGNEIYLLYYWKVLAPFENDVFAFTHIDLISQNTSVRYSLEHPILNKRYPLTKAKPGEIIKDIQILKLTSNTPSGKYTIRSGLWNGKKIYSVTNNIPNSSGDNYNSRNYYQVET